jgi:predicted metal-binding membrane protein
MLQACNANRQGTHCHAQVLQQPSTTTHTSTATGAAVNVRDGIYQQTPLHRVCFKGQQEKDIYSEELLLWLVTEGRADLFAVDRFGHKVQHHLYTVFRGVCRMRLSEHRCSAVQ